MRLKGKIAVITGASSGIGRATAILFAREGARVICVDVDEKGGIQTVDMINQEKQDASFIRADVSNSEEVQQMAKKCEQSVRQVDILFNNAGVPGETLDQTTEESWRRVVDINLTGPFLACMQALPQMRKQGGGNILNTSSIGGLQATGRSPSYTATKGGLAMLTRALARNLGKDNIRVNCICPGSVETGLTDAFMGFPATKEQWQAKRAASLSRIPLGRVAAPEDIAAAALFLASDEAKNITGQALMVDGGAAM